MKSLFYMIISLFFIIWISGCGKSDKTSDYDPGMSVDARIMDLQEKIEDQPNNLEWRYQLAKAYQEKGNNMEALRTLEDALLVDPNRTDLKYEYAELALKMGDRRKAYNAYIDILEGSDSNQYLSRIATKFVDTYQVTPLLNDTYPEAFPCYSADGNKILYQAFIEESWDIFEYDKFADIKKKIVGEKSHEENPVYSPDGNLIVYTSTKEDHRDVDYNLKLRDIYSLNLTTGLELNLTPNSSNDWRPRFSADGKFIVFVSERDDIRDLEYIDLYSDVYIMEKDGSFQMRLTNNEVNDGGPVLVGGEHGTIYFDSDRNGNYGIFKMHADGTEQKLVTTNLEFNDVAPDVSKDGTKIVFFSDRDGNYEIYIMNIDGSNQQRLTSNIAADTNPIFSPDGNKVIFHSDRSGNYDIFEINLDVRNDTPSTFEVIEEIKLALSALN